MSDSAATVRAVLTALGGVVVFAILLTVVVGTFLLGLGTIVGTVADVVSSPGGDGGQQFSMDHDGEAAIVTYVGDEPQPTGELLVEVDDEPRGSWADYGGNGDAVTTGDSIRVEAVDDGQAVAIVRIDDGDGEPTELFSETA